MIYGVDIIIGNDTFTAKTEASSLEEAEQTFIACLDSGDYDHFIQGRDFECGEIKLLKEK